MPFEVKSNNEAVKPILRMGHRLDTRRHHDNSGAAKEIKSSLENQSSDKYSVKNTVDKPYVKRHQNIAQLTSSGNRQNQWLGSKDNKDDELVKYMSNLPGYLQHAEKGKNIQGKALNFGVLDWERLEKWKYNERMPPRFLRKTLSSSSSYVSGRIPTTPSGGLSCEQKLPKLVQLSQSEIMQTQDLQAAQCRTRYGKQKQILRKEVPSRRRNSELNIDEYYRGSDTLRKMRPDEGDLSGEQSNHVHLPSHSTNSIQDCQSEIKLDSSAAESKNIVILVPKHRTEASIEASQFSESRTSFDERSTEAMSNGFSDCSSQVSFASTELHAVPHSCPLPAQDIKSNVCSSPRRNDRITTRSSFDAKYLKHPSETFQNMDLDSAEQSEVKGRHPLPSKRFNFSLSRMSRSFSFKETSTVPLVNITTNIPKSGPVNCGASSSTDIGTREKPNSGVRGRSSPLRRLLDPLLRLKGVHPSETYPPPPNGKTLPINVKKHQPSTLQALVQLTLKDGVPFFKLVVDDDGGILAAAVKKLPTSGKGGRSLVYAFYAVHEIKRKSGGWMSQGPKEKSPGFGYKVIGQMEIESSSRNMSVQRESVLYSIDSGQADKQVPDSRNKRELSAIVVMNSNQSQIHADFSGESKRYGDIVVILPGGTHGFPNDGAPSSLLERWRSGGLCDCGGWDVGCKLKVLELDKNYKDQDYLRLFIQGGDERSKPIFSMAPLKNGLYSVEFGSSIPLLEAFSICVSALTSHKLADMFETGPSQGQKDPVQGQVPQRYVPSPPPSPVGRI